MKLFKSAKALVIFALLFTTQIISQEAKVLPPGLDENDECSFKVLGDMFYSYYKYYFDLYYATDEFSCPDCDWSILRTQYKCKDLLIELMEKDRQRIVKTFTIKTPEDGIDKGILIAYGVYINPPYKIEADFNNITLSINNVQVWPLLRPSELPRSDFEFLEDKKTNSMHAMFDAIDDYLNLYKENIERHVEWVNKHLGRKKAKEYLINKLERMKDGRYIDDFIIYDDANLRFELFLWDYYGTDFLIKPIEERRKQFIQAKYFKKKKDVPINETKENQSEGKKKYLAIAAENISKHLLAGENVIVSATYSDFIPYYEFTNEKILHICEAILSGKSTFKKLIELKEIDKGMSIWGIGKEFIFNLKEDACRDIIKRLTKEKEK